MRAGEVGDLSQPDRGFPPPAAIRSQQTALEKRIPRRDSSRTDCLPHSFPHSLWWFLERRQNPAASFLVVSRSRRFSCAAAGCALTFPSCASAHNRMLGAPKPVRAVENRREITTTYLQLFTVKINKLTAWAQIRTLHIKWRAVNGGVRQARRKSRAGSGEHLINVNRPSDR